MTDHAISIAAARPGDAAAARLAAAFRREVMTGLRFSTRARSIALGAIAVLVAVQNWEAGAGATLYFEAVVALFFVFGIAHYRLAKSRFAHAGHKYIFATADVLLLGFVILMPSPFEGGFDPVAMHLRGPNFLYFLILLGGTVLS
jgi:hypothetical protein